MLGWTQNDLADRSGVAKRSIAGLELETSTPKPETMKRLVATLSGGGIEFRNSDVDGIGIMLRGATELFEDRSEVEDVVDHNEIDLRRSAVSERRDRRT